MAGRPRKEIDPIKVRRLAGAGLTVEEIAAILDVGERTLYRNFGRALKDGHTRLNASLKRKQFIVAMRGNPTMLIWLGKQYLGQTDAVVAIGPLAQGMADPQAAKRARAAALAELE